MAVNRLAFEAVAAELEAGEHLSFTKIARVFGPPAYELIIHALLSADEASAVIREAVSAAQEEEAVESSGN